MALPQIGTPMTSREERLERALREATDAIANYANALAYREDGISTDDDGIHAAIERCVKSVELGRAALAAPDEPPALSLEKRRGEGMSAYRSTCREKGPQGYLCTLLPGHLGDHVAETTTNRATGKNCIAETWPPEPAPQPAEVKAAMERFGKWLRNTDLGYTEMYADCYVLYDALESQQALAPKVLTRKQFDSAMEGYDVGNTTKQTVLERLNAALREEPSR